ncbi:MAG: hypothetical protein ACOCYP_09525 [Planctomycetota bacterium]
MDTDRLVADGRLLAPAIDAAAPSPAELKAALAATNDPAVRAALAIIAGRTACAEIIPELVALLDEDGLPGRAAGWALGRLPAQEPVLAAIRDGGLDTRENGYAALAGIAANGLADDGFTAGVTGCHEMELQRAAAGRTGLGEHACRALATAGAEAAGPCIERTLADDPYCDRYELQRLAKAMADRGCDQETRDALTGPWSTIFADDLAEPEEEEEAAASAPEDIAADHAGPEVPEMADDEATDDADLAAAPPIDWSGFASSPQAADLDPSAEQMITRFGPMLEQLSLQAVRAPLSDLSDQEFAAVLLQVLPQALPPQAVQAVLSPTGLNALQAMARWLVATQGASPGMVDAVKMVRETMREQIRASGMLGGPDYSDPDEPAPAE